MDNPLRLDYRGLSVDDPTVARVTRDVFGIEARQITRFAGETASTCRIDSARGALVVKLIGVPRHGVAEAQVLAWQAAVMDHLHRRGLPVPHPIPTIAGDLVSARFDLPTAPPGYNVVAHAATWLPGTPLVASDRGDDPELLADLGATTARLVTSLASAPAAPVAFTHDWDARGYDRALAAALATLQGLDRAGLASAGIDHDDLRAAHRALAHYRRELTPRRDLLPHSVVHHDLNDANVLVEGNRVVGVLDFGDLVPGWRIAEVSVVAGYAALGAADPAAAITAVVGGYQATAGPHSLTVEEHAVLLALAVARLAVNATVWTVRELSGSGGYASARKARTWPVLRRLASLDPTTLLL